MSKDVDFAKEDVVSLLTCCVVVWIVTLFVAICARVAAWTWGLVW